MSITITYTFSDDCPVKQLAGKKVTGGIPRIMPDGTEVVNFGYQSHIGTTVSARLAGKPDIQAKVEAYRDSIAARQAILSRIGWETYQSASNRAYAARAAYARAAGYGYPIKESAEMRAADEALAAARAMYPMSAAYAMAEDYSLSGNDVKAAAGRRAMRAIEAGRDPIETAAKMAAEWAADAERMVRNA